MQGIEACLSVDPKLIEISRSRYEERQIADNETLMLKIHIHYGLVSFRENDIHWQTGKQSM